MAALVAHRGYAACFPENTQLALESAVAAGARYLEVDIQLSADGVPFLFHDHDCQRLCGVSGTIDSYPQAYLATLSASYPSRFGDHFVHNPLATAADLVPLLKRNPALTVFVEIKRQAVARFGAQYVIDQTYNALKPVLSQTILISFSSAALVCARPLWAHIGAIADTYDALMTPAFAAVRPRYHFCDYAGLPVQGSLRRPGVALAVYEIDEATIARELIARGVDFIETFAIAPLQEALRGYL